MRQYRVYYRRPGSENWGVLEEGVHRSLYDVPAVHTALKVMREHPAIEAVCVRDGDALLNIVTFDQPALAPNAFTFESENQ